MTRVCEEIRRRRALVAPVLLAIAAAWFLLESFPRPAQADDAYIAYRYARNLVNGHGLVYNPGHPVEGYTSFAWVLLVAAGVGLGGWAPVVSFWLGVASSLALLAVSYGYARRFVHADRAWVAALAPLLVVASPCFAVWSTSGLETPLFAALVVGALHAQLGGRGALAIGVASLATLTRPEGVLVAAVVVASEFLDGDRARRRAVGMGAAYAVFIGALTAFRLVYFGAPLPNTFYAKVGGVPWAWATAYVAAFFVQAALPLVLPAALGADDSRESRQAVLYVALLNVYVVVIGGDVFQYSRFYLPAIPVVVALSLRGATAPGDGAMARLARGSIPVAFVWLAFGAPGGLVAWVVNVALAAVPSGDARRLAATSVLALAAGTAGLVVPRPPIDTARHVPSLRSLVVFDRWNAVVSERVIYRFLEEAVVYATAAMTQRPRPPRRVAAEGIGFLGWYFEGEVIDILGLVDPVIARSPARDDSGYRVPGHQRSNSDYVLSLAPDYIFIPPPGSALQLPAARELWGNPGFTRHYGWDLGVRAWRRWR